MSRRKIPLPPPFVVFVSAGFVPSEPDLDPNTQRDRSEFLRAIRDVAPKVLQSLWENVLPAYRKVRSRGGGLRNWSFLVKVKRGPDRDLRDRLDMWSTVNNLSDEWLKNVALSTCEQWDVAIWSHRFDTIPKSAPPGLALEPLDWWEPWKLGFGIFTSPLEDAPVLTLDVDDRWDPLLEHREAFRKRVYEIISGQLYDYLNRVERRAEEKGLRRAKPKSAPEHFKWLAQYVVHRLTPEQIREGLEQSVARKTVDSAIRRTAKRIGLHLPRAEFKPKIERKARRHGARRK